MIGDPYHRLAQLWLTLLTCRLSQQYGRSPLRFFKRMKLFRRLRLPRFPRWRWPRPGRAIMRSRLVQWILDAVFLLRRYTINSPWLKRAGLGIKNSLLWIGGITGISALLARLSGGSQYQGGGRSALVQFVVDSYNGLEEYLANTIWLRWLYFLLWGIRGTLYRSLDFALRWLTSRDYKLLLGGIPAFLFLLPIGFSLAWASLDSPQKKAQHYHQAALEAWKEKDFDKVQLYYRKISQLGVGYDYVKLDEAIRWADAGEIQKAYDQMIELAPLDDKRTGLIPAHLWIARGLLNNELPVPAEERQRLCQRHLDRVFGVDKGNTGALHLQAILFLRQKRYGEALRTLEQVVARDPAGYGTSAQVHYHMGDTTTAQRAAQVAAGKYEEMKERQRELLALDYRNWATAYGYLGQPARTEQVLREGLKKYPQNEELVAAAVGFCTARFDQLYHLGQATEAERLRLVQWAYGLIPSDTVPSDTVPSDTVPSDTELLQRVAVLASLQNQIGQQAGVMLQPLMAEKKLPAHVHALLGMAAYKNGQLDRARAHFERLAELVAPQPGTAGQPGLDADSASVFNNLAHLLIQTEPQDLQRARQMADRAVKLDPENLNFRETRGQILIQLRNWQAAIDDLNLALSGMPDRPQIHDALALAYGQLGETELQQAHQQRSAILPRHPQ